MRIAKWGNSLAVRLPTAVVEALRLKEGDEVEIRVADLKTFDVARDPRRERAMERIRALEKKLPVGWKFDRGDANAR
jgi:antitoxin MazE